jgi:hypothetical protein
MPATRAAAERLRTADAPALDPNGTTMPTPAPTALEEPPVPRTGSANPPAASVAVLNARRVPSFYSVAGVCGLNPQFRVVLSNDNSISNGPSFNPGSVYVARTLEGGALVTAELVADLPVPLVALEAPNAVRAWLHACPDGSFINQGSLIFSPRALAALIAQFPGFNALPRSAEAIQYDFRVLQEWLKAHLPSFGPFNDTDYSCLGSPSSSNEVVQSLRELVALLVDEESPAARQAAEKEQLAHMGSALAAAYNRFRTEKDLDSCLAFKSSYALALLNIAAASGDALSQTIWRDFGAAFNANAADGESMCRRLYTFASSAVYTENLGALEPSASPAPAAPLAPASGGGELLGPLVQAIQALAPGSSSGGMTADNTRLLNECLSGGKLARTSASSASTALSLASDAVSPSIGDAPLMALNVHDFTSNNKLAVLIDDAHFIFHEQNKSRSIGKGVMLQVLARRFGPTTRFKLRAFSKVLEEFGRPTDDPDILVLVGKKQVRAGGAPIYLPMDAINDIADMLKGLASLFGILFEEEVLSSSSITHLATKLVEADDNVGGCLDVGAVYDLVSVALGQWARSATHNPSTSLWPFNGSLLNKEV